MRVSSVGSSVRERRISPARSTMERERLAAHDERYADRQWYERDEDPGRKILDDEREQQEADDLHYQYQRHP